MFARTERLLLRPGFIEDAPALAEAIGDEGIVRNLARAPWPYGEAEAHTFLTMERPELYPDFIILQRTAGKPRLIGGVGFAPAQDGTTEFGYWIARPHWGLGFASEAGRAALAVSRALGLGRITAAHFVDNPASGAVLRKLGFRATGRIVQRNSVARACNVSAVEYRLPEGTDDGDTEPQMGKRCPIGPDEDIRQQLRLIAA